MNTITVKGTRTKLWLDGTTKSCKVKVVFALKDKRSLYIIKGGVTGYESFCIECFDDFQKMIDKGWTACAGTKGSWDRLFIPGKSMKEVFEFFNLVEKETSHE